MRRMYDSITAAAAPADGDLYAGYIDGRWQSYNSFVTRFPGKRVVKIAVFASTTGGEVYDVEQGDLTPAQVPGVLVRERAAGGWPTIYCNLENHQQIIDAVNGAGIPQPPYWIAHWTEQEHMEDGATVTQWSSQQGFDVSLVADSWPGIDVQHVIPPTYTLPRFDAPVVDVQVTAFFPQPFGELVLCQDGAVYTIGSAQYHGGANGQPYFAGRTAARFDALTPAEQAAGKAYVIEDTIGERYAFPV